MVLRVVCNCEQILCKYSIFIVVLHNLKVIYAGLVVASGGADLTIWLLFAFVVTVPFPNPGFFLCVRSLLL